MLFCIIHCIIIRMTAETGHSFRLLFVFDIRRFNLKRYFGDKAFYKMVLGIAVPVMIQNGITNLVGLLDNIMVGQIGTEQMSGVAIVNQLIFIFFLRRLKEASWDINTIRKEASPMRL